MTRYEWLVLWQWHDHSKRLSLYFKSLCWLSNFTLAMSRASQLRHKGIEVEVFQPRMLLFPQVWGPGYASHVYVLVSPYNKVSPFHITAIHLALYLVVVVMSSFEFVFHLPILLLPLQTEGFDFVAGLLKSEISCNVWDFVLNYTRRLGCVRAVAHVIRTSCQPRVINTDNETYSVCFQTHMTLLIPVHYILLPSCVLHVCTIQCCLISLKLAV